MVDLKAPGVVSTGIIDKTYSPGFVIYAVPEGENYRIYLKHEKLKQIKFVITSSPSMHDGFDEMIQCIMSNVPVLHDTIEMYIKFYFSFDDCKTVKELRYKSGLRQKDFAEHFGIPLSTFQKWEQAVNPVPGYVFKMMQTILKSQA